MRMTAVSFALLCGIASALPTSALGQSRTVTASFGNFYGEQSAELANPQTVEVMPQSAGGIFSLSCCNTYQTSVGTISVPTYWNNITGKSTLEMPVTFSPNGVDGAFSGSFTVTYSNSEYSNEPLTLTVNFSGYSMVPRYTAAPAYMILSILYDPPGSASSSGFANATSAGASSSVCNNFSTSACY